MLTKNNRAGQVAWGEHFKKSGNVISNGQRLDYTVETEELIFLDEENRPEASMVTYFFSLDCEYPEQRPVLFVIAGGPGAASSTLSLGLYGAKIYDFEGEEKIKPQAPYTYKDNDDWILDICDIVLIDPVGTGYAKLYQKSAAAKYFGHEQDCYALAKGIAFWLVQHRRTNSPKFFNGVSYGGQRTCLLPRYLFGGLTLEDETYGLSFNGLIQMGDACLFSTNRDDEEVQYPEDQIPQICYLTAGYAATNWYHHPHLKKQTQFVDEAYRFGMGELRHELTDPNISLTCKKNLADTLSGYIGVPAEIILEKNFEIDPFSFCYELQLGEEMLSCGMYDGRTVLPGGAYGTTTFDMISDDASLAPTWSAVSALTPIIYQQEYDIHFLDGRVPSCQNFEAYSQWDWSIKENTRPIDWQLFNMRHQKSLRLMIVSGLYDLCWNVGYSRYTYESMGLPEERTDFKVYPSGHSMYFDEKSRHLMAADFREFITKSI